MDTHIECAKCKELESQLASAKRYAEAMDRERVAEKSQRDSAETELAKLRQQCGLAMRATEEIFDCEPEDQQGQARFAVSILRSALSGAQCGEENKP